MNPDTWLAQLQQICSDSDWDAFSNLRKTTNQSFSSSFDSEGLIAFYEKLAASGLDESKFSEVQVSNISDFQSEVAAAFQAALTRLPNMPQVKGIYFEYFYDGGDSGTGNLFLCNEYSDEDDFWGAEFDQDGMIDGPDVSPFFGFDPDFEWDPYQRYVAEEYVNGRLLAAVLEEWKKSGIAGLPFGFANHDHEMVRAPAN